LKKACEIILKEIEKQLKYISRKNKKLIICFVGIPCSGKTRLAKKLEEKYKGVRINSDYIRKIIDKFVKEENERESILKEFILDFLRNYSYKNKLVILDSGIERKYEDIVEISKSKKWRMFIIRVVAEKKIILERIKKKDRDRYENRYEDIERWFKEYKEFNKKVDFIFKGDRDLENLYSKLDVILR
jgi:predicted kinase